MTYSGNQSGTSSGCANDEPYYDQAVVNVRKSSREEARKISPVIIGRGIANPGYLQKNDVIPIKVVPMKDGSLKRYKSELYKTRSVLLISLMVSFLIAPAGMHSATYCTLASASCFPINGLKSVAKSIY